MRILVSSIFIPILVNSLLSKSPDNVYIFYEYIHYLTHIYLSEQSIIKYMLIKDLFTTISSLALTIDVNDLAAQESLITYLNMVYEELYGEISQYIKDCAEYNPLTIDSDLKETIIPRQFHNIFLWGCLFYLAYEDRDKLLAFELAHIESKYQLLKNQLIIVLFNKTQPQIMLYGI